MCYNVLKWVNGSLSGLNNWGTSSRKRSTLCPKEKHVTTFSAITVKERWWPVGLPATGCERHGVQGSTPVSEGCDRYHPLLLP